LATAPYAPRAFLRKLKVVRWKSIMVVTSDGAFYSPRRFLWVAGEANVFLAERSCRKPRANGRKGDR
jgi:hypothetical protein